MERKNYYRILGVPRGADADEIREAYRSLAKKHHPDRAGQEGTAHFQDIVEAYEVLSDPERRRDYNRTLEPRSRPSPPPAPRPPTFPTPPWGRMFGLSPRPSELHVEIVLDRAEAAQGGLLPLTLPADMPCPACGGSGRDLYLPCPLCRGQGRRPTSRTQTVQVRIPPGIPDGARLQVPLHHRGYSHILRIDIRVTP